MRLQRMAQWKDPGISPCPKRRQWSSVAPDLRLSQKAESMAGMESYFAQFSHFYCSLFVESICVRCGEVVARAPTREALEQHESLHSCSKHMEGKLTRAEEP